MLSPDLALLHQTCDSSCFSFAPRPKVLSPPPAVKPAPPSQSFSMHGVCDPTASFKSPKKLTEIFISDTARVCPRHPPIVWPFTLYSLRMVSLQYHFHRKLTKTQAAHHPPHHLLSLTPTAKQFTSATPGDGGWAGSRAPPKGSGILPSAAASTPTASSAFVCERTARGGTLLRSGAAC